MGLGERINRFFMNFEWRTSLFMQGVGIVASFALPAWAVNAANIFAEYSPFSWVAAGFAGVLLAVIIYALYALAYGRLIKSRYDQNLYERTGFVDPMLATFENKRIFLSDFVLPSDAYIYGKTFINCEIVGPANLFLRGAYRVDEQRLPSVDAVALNGDRQFFNGVIVENCIFRACSFRRITLMMLPHEYEQYRHLNWLNWISRPPDPQQDIPGLEPIIDANPQPQLPSDKPA